MFKNYVCRFRAFLFDQSWNRIFLELADEDAGALIKAVLNYAEGKNLPPENNTLNAIYSVLTERMNISSRHFFRKLVKNGIMNPPIRAEYMPMFIEARKKYRKSIAPEPNYIPLSVSEETQPKEDSTKDLEEVDQVSR